MYTHNKTKYKRRPNTISKQNKYWHGKMLCGEIELTKNNNKGGEEWKEKRKEDREVNVYKSISV